MLQPAGQLLQPGLKTQDAGLCCGFDSSWSNGCLAAWLMPLWDFPPLAGLRMGREGAELREGRPELLHRCTVTDCLSL